MCPNCGRGRPTVKSVKWTTAVAICVGIFSITWLAAAGNIESNSAANLDYERDISAMTFGQNAIREQLKFPSTAEFSEHRYGRISGDEYFYTALVRAENSFGQQPLSRWQVVLEFETDSYSRGEIISVTQTQ